MAGRPEVRTNIAALARKATTKALSKIEKLIDDADPRVALDAAREILNRGYGKPLTMTADLSDKLGDWDDATLDAAISTLRASIETAQEGGIREGQERVTH